MTKNTNQFHYVVYLRTFVFYNALLLYLFFGNVYSTVFVTLGLEIVFSIALYLKTLTFQGNTHENMHHFYIDVGISIGMSVVASFGFILSMYMFDTVIVIGSEKTLAAVFLLAFLNIIRIVDVVLVPSGHSWVVLLGLVLLFGTCIVILTDNSFFIHSHTITVSVVYSLFCIFITMLSFKIGYYVYVVYIAVLVLVLSLAWPLASDRDFSFYMNQK